MLAISSVDTRFRCSHLESFSTFTKLNYRGSRKFYKIASCKSFLIALCPRLDKTKSSVRKNKCETAHFERDQI
jgi:hypothetical protein